MRQLLRDAYTPISKHGYFRALDLAKQMPFRASLASAQAVERLPAGRLGALQLEKLRAMLAHAQAHCPFYADRFKACGLAPAALRSVADLAALPVLTKVEIFEHRARMTSKVFRGRLWHGSTSGSTGVALQFDYDSHHAAWVYASVWRGRGWWGVSRGDREFVLWARPVVHTWWSDRKAWLKHRLRNCVQIDAFADFDAGAVIAQLKAVRPRIIYGYGSSVGRLAEAMAARGVTLAAAERPVFVEYTGDHMYPSERQVAARVFGAPVISAYGSSDCGGVAQECRHGRLHMSIDHMLVEFLRPDGSPAEPGEMARIVLTELNNQAMPLLRYEVGDQGSYSAEACPCGVTLPVMNLGLGKTADVIDTSTRSGVSAYVLDYINIHLMKNGIRGIKQYLVVQTAPDDFQVSFVKETPFEQRSVDVFLAKLRDYLGESITTTVSFVDAIPSQRSGKRRYFLKAFGVEREAAAARATERASGDAPPLR